MKKLISAILILTLMLGLCACKSQKIVYKGDNNINPAGSSDVSSTEPGESEAPNRREELSEVEDFLSHPDPTFDDSSSSGGNPLGGFGDLDLPLLGPLLVNTLRGAIDFDTINYVDGSSAIEGRITLGGIQTDVIIKLKSDDIAQSKYQFDVWDFEVPTSDQQGTMKIKESEDRYYCNITGVAMDEYSLSIDAEFPSSAMTDDLIVTWYTALTRTGIIGTGSQQMIPLNALDSYIPGVYKQIEYAAGQGIRFAMWDPGLKITEAQIGTHNTTVFARAKKSEKREDIARLQTGWASSTTINIADTIQGEHRQKELGGNIYNYVLWFDANKGITYSLEWTGDASLATTLIQEIFIID